MYHIAAYEQINTSALMHLSLCMYVELDKRKMDKHQRWNVSECFAVHITEHQGDQIGRILDIGQIKINFLKVTFAFKANFVTEKVTHLIWPEYGLGEILGDLGGHWAIFWLNRSSSNDISSNPSSSNSSSSNL
jgi:hypothetical protein